MPVSLLLVEGDLDLQVLRPICGGSPVVEIGGSKYSPGTTLAVPANREEDVCLLSP
jgi:hypothetical protein